MSEQKLMMNNQDLNITKKIPSQKFSIILGIIVIIIALVLSTSIYSFQPDDPGWGVATSNEPKNLLSYLGSYIASLVVKELGLFSGFFISCIFFILGIQLLRKNKIIFSTFKLFGLIILICFSGLFSEVVRRSIINLFGSENSFFHVNGISKFFYDHILNYLDLNFKIYLFNPEFILNFSIIVFIFTLLFWLLAISINDLKFICLIFKPIVLPIYWLSILAHNLFFKTYGQTPLYEDLLEPKNHNTMKENIYKFFRMKINFGKNKRNKIFVKKEPILIKSSDFNGDSKITENTTIRTKSSQRNLNLSSETGFDLPSTNLLQSKLKNEGKKPDKDVLDSNARLLEGVLNDFSINGNIETVRHGPVVTRYDLKPAPGLRSQRVISLADDIARSMAAESVRVAMVPGQDVIGIELPNKERETVVLRSILEDQEFESSTFKLPICLGKNIAGSPVVADLSKMPHLLVAGTTGSGKSVGINAMILSLLYKHTPEFCKFIMIDPKMLELSVYDGIPHLLTPVVTDPKKAIIALKWAVREMETRYLSMSKIGVRNIESYNERLAKARKSGEVLTKNFQVGFDSETGEPIFEEQQIDLNPLPFIVVVIDEVADLMLVAGKEIEAAVQRLAQMARAAGIHVIMATQRPSVDVITGTIKANFPTRISFQVFSKIDSRTILGEQGAEQLLGRGDMLYMAGGGKIVRVHGPFVDDKEVEKVTRFLSSQSLPSYDESITEEPKEESDYESSGLINNNSQDPIYDEAVKLVVREQKASTSFIQRHLRIGYNRAATIIEKMEENDIISKPGRAGKREIFIQDV